MTKVEHETFQQALIVAWATADKAKSIVEKEGVAAHEAGNTLRQHKLETLYHTIDKATLELADAIRQLDNIRKGERK
jgi:hypothetical protein